MDDSHMLPTFARLRGVQLPRPRVMTLFSDIPGVSLTVVKAGAGYGKTTAVATYSAQAGIRCKWLTVREEDRDGVRFVERLCTAFLGDCASDREREGVVSIAHSPLTWLTSAEWAANLAEKTVHGAQVWILDDLHALDDDYVSLKWIDAWLRRLPSFVHIVLITRTTPALPWLEALSLRGDALWIRERELAFTEEEIGFLFASTLQPQTTSGGPALTRNEVRGLLTKTLGMPMVLAMLLRDWQLHGSYTRLQAALEEQTPLTHQVGRLFLQGLSRDERSFLAYTCLFSTLHPGLCDQTLGRVDSADVLAEMERKGHIALADDVQTYELHPLVRDYLAAGLSQREQDRLLESAILWHLNREEEAKAISYLFVYRDQWQAAAALLPYIPKYLARGQVSTVQGWIDRFDLKVLEASAGLMLAKAEVLRHTNSFSEALNAYDRAAVLAEKTEDSLIRAQVDMGRARLYLDTIQPARAAPHIRQARRRLRRRDVALRMTLLQLAFENSINQGRITRATRLYEFLAKSGEGALPNNNSDARLLLRTGKIAQVVALLKNRVGVEPLDGRSALAHREASLLLSLMYAMNGEAQQSKVQALRGHIVGDSLHSPFVSAVGYIRLGHAEHLLNPLGDDALKSYEQAVVLMDDMEVARGKSEALLGLCLAYGYRSQFAVAKFHAEEGIAIAEFAGDRWMANLVRLTYGQVCVVNEELDAAVPALTKCVEEFTRCQDVFLATAARLWRAVAYFRLHDDRCHDDLASVLRTAERHGWDFLLQSPTCCGLRDTQTLTPLLHAHRLHGQEPRRALQLMDRLHCSELDYHPGFTLRVETLGRFKVWRGFTEVSHRDWPREKARQLFLFLLTKRGTLLHREEICEQLWGNRDPLAAERDFKVALNTLSSVLEPSKPGRGPSVFILRQGAMYCLTGHDMVSVDRDVFVRFVEEAGAVRDVARRQFLLRQALDTYQGDFVPEVRYEDWCDNERDRLKLIFTHAALEYAELAYASQDFDAALLACQRAISVEPTWEDAYVWLMKTYAALYNRPMVIKTYRACERVMKQELGVLPMVTTRQVYETILSS